MRVAIYTRLSPNPRKVDTINQERDLTEFANRNSWKIVEVYKDILVSGCSEIKDRPSFERMMKDASQRKFDLLLFWAMDRLSREGGYKVVTYLRQLDSWGVGFRSYTESYLDSCGPFKDTIMTMMGDLARVEKCKLIDRTVAGLETARGKGIKLGRAFATRVTVKHPIALDIEKAKQMRVEGITLLQIAKKFKKSEATISRYLKGVKPAVKGGINING